MRVAALFYDIPGADRAMGLVRRAGKRFHATLVTGGGGGEAELAPGVTLTQAVLGAAARGAARGEAAGRAQPAPQEPGTGLRARLEALGLAAHRVDWCLKHILNGHVLAVLDFDQDDAAAWAAARLQGIPHLWLERFSPSETGAGGIHLILPS